MSFFEKTKGSISVFLIMTLMPMYTCAYLAIDTAKYTAAESKISGAMDLTGNAALAGYDEELKELYGIFAMSKDEETLENELVSYFSRMIDNSEVTLYSDTFVRTFLNKVIEKIAIMSGGSTDITNFENTVCTETVEFTSSYVETSRITCTETLESEIRRFMKYRAPYNFVNGTAQKLSAILKVDQFSEMLERDEDGKINFSSFINMEDAEVATGSNEQSGDISFVEAMKIMPELSEMATTDLSKVYQVSEELSRIRISSLMTNALYETSKETTNIFDSFENKDVFSLIKSTFSEVDYSFDVVAEKAYEVEYITEMFACLTTSNTEQNLCGTLFGERAFLPGEMEYIIFGNDKLSSNFVNSLGTIFAFRVVLNSIYVFSNANTRQSALAVATALSGINGIGTVMTQNLILLAWAMAESVMDVSSLCKGQIVPIYKSALTWTLSLENVPNTLAKGVTSYAVTAIDDIFFEIENATLNGYENMCDVLESYLNRTSEGVTQSLTNMILTPVEENITQIISEEIGVYTASDISKILTDTVNSIDNSSKGFTIAKNSFVKYVLPELSKILEKNLSSFSSNDPSVLSAAQRTLQNALSDSYINLFSYIDEAVSNIEAETCSSFYLLSDLSKNALKDKAVEIIDAHGEKLSSFLGEIYDESGSIGNLQVATYSGMGMNYEDYLKVIAFLRIMDSEEKERMLMRTANIMQINCSDKNSNFNLDKCYTSVELIGMVKIGQHQITSKEVYSYS